METDGVGLREVDGRVGAGHGAHRFDVERREKAEVARRADGSRRGQRVDEGLGDALAVVREVAEYAEADEHQLQHRFGDFAQIPKSPESCRRPKNQNFIFDRSANRNCSTVSWRTDRKLDRNYNLTLLVSRTRIDFGIFPKSQDRQKTPENRQTKIVLPSTGAPTEIILSFIGAFKLVFPFCFRWRSVNVRPGGFDLRKSFENLTKAAEKQPPPHPGNLGRYHWDGGGPGAGGPQSYMAMYDDIPVLKRARPHVI